MLKFLKPLCLESSIFCKPWLQFERHQYFRGNHFQLRATHNKLYNDAAHRNYGAAAEAEEGEGEEDEAVTSFFSHHPAAVAAWGYLVEITVDRSGRFPPLSFITHDDAEYVQGSGYF